MFRGYYVMCGPKRVTINNFPLRLVAVSIPYIFVPETAYNGSLKLFTMPSGVLMSKIFPPLISAILLHLLASSM